MWNWNCCVLVVFWVQGLVERRLGGGAVWSRDEEEGTTRPPPTLEMDGNRAAVHGTWCHVSGLFEDATTDIEACSSSSASSLTRVLLPPKKLQAARRKFIKEWWQWRQACILVHCSAFHPTGHPVGAFLHGTSLSPSQPTHLLLVGVLLIRVFFLGFCDGWQQQDGCHTKKKLKVFAKDYTMWEQCKSQLTTDFEHTCGNRKTQLGSVNQQESQKHKYSVYIHARPGYVYTTENTQCRSFLNRQLKNSVQVCTIFLVLGWVPVLLQYC